MHYYKFNIADYRKDTVHLSPMEHYIYRSLIDWYYLDEKMIPIDSNCVLRRIGLGASEINILLSVLNDFFIETKKGYQHKRIEEEIKKYNSMVDRNKANGSNGGRPVVTELKPSGLQNKPSRNLNQEPLTTNHKPITNNQIMKKKCFIKPSINEVISYCNLRANNVDPEKWMSYYEANGWRVGKNPMKDWQASIRTWEKNEKPVGKAKIDYGEYDPFSNMKLVGASI